MAVQPYSVIVISHQTVRHIAALIRYTNKSHLYIFLKAICQAIKCLFLFLYLLICPVVIHMRLLIFSKTKILKFTYIYLNKQSVRPGGDRRLVAQVLNPPKTPFPCTEPILGEFLRQNFRPT